MIGDILIQTVPRGQQFLTTVSVLEKYDTYDHGPYYKQLAMAVGPTADEARMAAIMVWLDLDELHD